jgi:hypothetical protein
MKLKPLLRKKYRLTDTINIGEVTVIATTSRIYMLYQLLQEVGFTLYGEPDKQLIVTPDLEKYGTVTQLLGARRTFMAGISLPIFVIDGMKVPYDVFRSFPTNMIDRIDVLNTQASISIFGANTEWVHQQLVPADGVLSITTRRDGPLNSNAKVYYTAKAKFSGYNEPRIFYSPKHHSTLKQILNLILEPHSFGNQTLNWKTEKILYLTTIMQTILLLLDYLLKV